MKRFEQELIKADWQQVREGLEVKLCPSPDREENFILCRSAERAAKEKAIHDRFEKRLEKGLTKLADGCQKKKQKLGAIERRVGRLLEGNSRAAGLFQVKVVERVNGGVDVIWEKAEDWRAWAELSEGCYLLRSNVIDWDAEQLWRAYIQLTEAEAGFGYRRVTLELDPYGIRRKSGFSHIYWSAFLPM